MVNEDLTRSLAMKSEELGADLFGVAAAKGFLDEAYTGGRPQDIMESCRSVVVLGVALPLGSIEPPPGGRAEYINSLLTATVLLRSMSFDLARWLERKSFKATIVPAEGSEFGYGYVDKKALKTGLSLRYSAYLANLSQYGLS